jgi:hypothetical protein
MAFKFNPLTSNFDLVTGTGGEAADIEALEAIVNSLQQSIGSANGIASLDGGGKVPASQLPSFVDDVIEADDFDSLPVVGETGKIYVTLDDNKTYRWTGSIYIEISATPENVSFLFDVEDWQIDSGDYILIIPADSHLKGINPQVQVYELDGNEAVNVIIYTSISENGDILLAVPIVPDNRFTGKAIIS